MTHPNAPPDDPRELLRIQAVDAERFTIQACLDSDEALQVAKRSLTVDHFWDQTAGAAFLHLLTGTTSEQKIRTLLIREGKDAERIMWLFDAASAPLSLMTKANEYIDAVKYGWGARERLKLARKLAPTDVSPNGEAGATSVQVAETMARIEAAEQPRKPTRGQRLRDLLSKDLQPPQSFLHGQLIARGDMAIMAGQGGVGKTQLALSLALATAGGEEAWMELGLESNPPLTTGYLALELSEARAGLRLKNMGFEEPARDLLVIATRSEFPRAPDLLSRDGVSELRQWVEDHGLQFVILDPLARMMGNREETNENFGALVDGLDEIRYATGCTMLLIHHEPKAPASGSSNDRNPLDRLRGGSKLGASATAVVIAERVGRTESNFYRLVWAKANNCRTPADTYYTIPEAGMRPHRCQSPADKANDNREKVRRAIVNSLEPISPADIARATGLSKNTVTKHAQFYVEENTVLAVGEGKSRRYCMVSTSQPPNEGF